MSEWKSIESAPKDTTRILLFCARALGNVRTGAWSSDEMVINNRVAWRNSGWWMDGFDHLFNEVPFVPTHWMPLPDPPVTA